MTIRKNFNLDEEIVKQLEEIAKIEHTTQTQAVQEAIEKLYKEKQISKKLAALDELAGSFSGMLSDVDAKDIQRQRAINRAK